MGCGVTWGWSGAKSVQIWAYGSRPECHHCLSQTQLLGENEMGVNRPPPLEQFGGSEGSVWMVSSLRQVSVGEKWFISGVGTVRGKRLPLPSDHDEFISGFFLRRMVSLQAHPRVHRGWRPGSYIRPDSTQKPPGWGSCIRDTTPSIPSLWLVIVE